MTRKFVGILAALALLIMGFAAVAQADYTITLVDHYLPTSSTDKEAFTTICPSVVVKNFEDAMLIPGLSITEVNGAGTIHDGVYQNSVRGFTGRYQVFNYSPGMYGFGAWFDLAGPGGPGSEIDLYINDNMQFVVTIPRDYAGQFQGFFVSSDDPFYGVRFVDHENPLGNQETYALVDLAVCPVPVPPAFSCWAVVYWVWWVSGFGGNSPEPHPTRGL